MTSSWLSHKTPTFGTAPQLLHIGDNEMVMLPQKREYDSEYEDDEDGIHKYNALHDKYTKIMDYPRDLVSISHSAAYDEKSKLIYVCNPRSQLIEIDIDSKKVNILSTNANYNRTPLIFVVDDDIHIMNWRKSKYGIFNKSTQTFKQMTDTEYIMSPWTVCMKLRQSIITTAIQKTDNKIVTMMNEYSYINKKWINWEIEGISCYRPRIVVTKFEEYLIFMGGKDMKTRMRSKDILVYNFKHKQMRKSSIKIPCSHFTVVLDRNDDREDVLLSSYMNKLWRNPEFVSVQLLPFYLTKLIGKYICFEYVHLVGLNDKDHSYAHWSINVDKIIQSMQ